MENKDIIGRLISFITLLTLIIFLLGFVYCQSFYFTFHTSILPYVNTNDFINFALYGLSNLMLWILITSLLFPPLYLYFKNKDLNKIILKIDRYIVRFYIGYFLLALTTVLLSELIHNKLWATGYLSIQFILLISIFFIYRTKKNRNFTMSIPATMVILLLLVLFINRQASIRSEDLKERKISRNVELILLNDTIKSQSNEYVIGSTSNYYFVYLENDSSPKVRVIPKEDVRETFLNASNASDGKLLSLFGWITQ